MTRILRMVAAALALAALLTAGGAHATATFIIENGDGAGEGFNDPTPWTPTGGNPATTLGQARLNAFQYAADLWGQLVSSNVVIKVDAAMDVLTCTPSSAVLGQAGTQTVHRNFGGAPLTGTYYPQALANALAGVDLSNTINDIGAVFNSALNGDVGCLGGLGWYYGFDGNPPGGDIDFVTVVMHELGHGLGFQTFMDLSTGQKFNGFNDMYLVHMEDPTISPSNLALMADAQRAAACIDDPDLRWGDGDVTYMAGQVPLTGGLNAGYVRLHAPNPLVPGSSVAHWSTAVTPNEVMEPVLTGPRHDPGLAVFLMKDIGWPMDASVAAVWSGVSATVAGDGVVLAWNWQGTEPIVGFRVYRANDAKGLDEELTTDGLLAPAARQYVDLAPPAGAALQYTVAAVRTDGGEVRSPAVSVTMAVAGLALAQNRPNPFNPSTSVDFTLDRSTAVNLRVYDAAGRLVRTLVSEVRPAGRHTATWDGRDDAGRRVASGAYVCRLEAGLSVRAVRMTMLK
ncbi:MAG TPA: FlgD immunoglobulin-like domain containing protein [Candidatus Krumholzibacteria bacterium]|nr:FlgD immunoglobulin-like domain containing protein [Candidatus Krumholzibacteria bacterium]